MSLPFKPCGRFNKPGWLTTHNELKSLQIESCPEIILIGDSIVAGLSRYQNIWKKHFGHLKILNLGLAGDRTQHVLWRAKNITSPGTKYVVIHCGTNNVDVDHPKNIADGVISIGHTFTDIDSNTQIVISGILPRDPCITSKRREVIFKTNNFLETMCYQQGFHFLKPDDNWLLVNGRLNNNLYYKDDLHLIEGGNNKLASSIATMLTKLKSSKKVYACTTSTYLSCSPAPNFVNCDNYGIGQSECLGRGWNGNPNQQHQPTNPPSTTPYILPLDDYPPLPPPLVRPIVPHRVYRPVRHPVFHSTPPPVSRPIPRHVPLPVSRPVVTRPVVSRPTLCHVPCSVSSSCTVLPHSSPAKKVTKKKDKWEKCWYVHRPSTSSVCKSVSTSVRKSIKPIIHQSKVGNHKGVKPSPNPSSTTPSPTPTPISSSRDGKHKKVPIPQPHPSSTTSSRTTPSPTTTSTSHPQLISPILKLLKQNLIRNLIYYTFLYSFLLIFLTYNINEQHCNFPNSTPTNLSHYSVASSLYFLSNLSTHSIYIPQNQNLNNVYKTDITFLLFPALCLIYFVSKVSTAKYKVDGPIDRSLILKNQRKLRRRRNFSLSVPVFIFIIKYLVMLDYNIDMYSTQIDVSDSDIFTEQSIKLMNQYTCNSTSNNFNLLVLSKSKIYNYSTFFRLILLLSGDINLNPGPFTACSICNKNVNKRSLQCEICLTRTHKMCADKVELGNYKCKACSTITNISEAFDLDSSSKFIDPDLIPPPNLDDSNKNLDDETWNKFNERGLHFIHLNINSLLPKIYELRQIASKTNAAVIGITESKLDDTVLDAEIEIDGYSLARSDRNRHGGGVVCYIRDNINYSLRSNFSNDFEHILLDLLLPNTKPILIGIIYNPPNNTGFIENLNTAILGIETFSEQEVFLLGDLNINLLNKKGKYALNGHGISENIQRQYKNLCTTQGLSQLITAPTRISENTSTLLDHVLTNTNEKTSQSGVIDVGLSDHQLVFCTRKITKVKFSKHKRAKIRSMKKYSKDKFLEELDKTDFPDYSQFEDVHKAYSDFSDKLLSAMEKISPSKEVRIKNNNQEWFDGEVLEKIKERDKLFRKYKKSKLQVDREIYQKARNAAHSIILKKKKQHVQEALQENIGKPKELWKTLQGLGLKSNSKRPQNICLKTEDGVSFDTETNANIFKNFFSNLAENLVKKLPKSKNVFGLKSVETYYKNFNLQDKKFSLALVNKDYIKNLLSEVNISKAAGIDSISGQFLRDGASSLALPVMQLINLSNSLSTVPDKSKLSKLKPLFKKGSKTDPKNYRPISLLPLVSKIFERAVYDQLHQFLEENKILYKYQSGFRKYHSTNTCLSHLSNKILQGFDEGMVTGMILIDLQKAFDTLDHDILLKKMKTMGFAENTIAWFRSYLSNRFFLVNIGNTFSEPS